MQNICLLYLHRTEGDFRNLDLPSWMSLRKNWLNKHFWTFARVLNSATISPDKYVGMKICEGRDNVVKVNTCTGGIQKMNHCRRRIVSEDIVPVIL